ncbi:toll/interleukin-1 receptor domain-containing protein [bacterium]|nr:toll/interleukin-1 receptor domain-containing protein [bacterium]
MSHYFLSYSRQDADVVDRLRDDLTQAQIEVWIDQIGLQPGTPDWDEALRQAIGHSKGVLLIATPSSRRSSFVRDEVALARAAKKRIFPLWMAGEAWLVHRGSNEPMVKRQAPCLIGPTARLCHRAIEILNKSQHFCLEIRH